MSVDELDEATAILATMMTALRGTLAGATGTPAADLYYAVGDLLANAPTLYQTSALGTPLAGCFALAVTAGATVIDMEAVRIAMMAEAPINLAGIATANAGIQMALASEVRILAATTFVSTQDVDAALTAINDAFDPAEEYAADSHDPTVFQALIAAHAACVQDLVTRARPLPKLVTYAVARPMTSHALAYRLYGDATRCDQLRDENKVIYPAFMPKTGVALSN